LLYQFLVVLSEFGGESLDVRVLFVLHDFVLHFGDLQLAQTFFLRTLIRERGVQLLYVGVLDFDYFLQFCNEAFRILEVGVDVFIPLFFVFEFQSKFLLFGRQLVVLFLEFDFLVVEFAFEVVDFDVILVDDVVERGDRPAHAARLVLREFKFVEQGVRVFLEFVQFGGLGLVFALERFEPCHLLLQLHDLSTVRDQRVHQLLV